MTVAARGIDRERAKAELSAHPPSRDRFHFRDDVAIENLSPPESLADDHVPKGGFCVVYAPPEHLKTFFLLALAFSVATGIPFFGRKVKRGLVVYVAAEGSAGLPVRVGAWKQSNEFYDKAGVYFLTEPVQLLDAPAVGTFLAALDTLPEPPVLIIFDTLHRCMAGADENSAKDMGIAIQAIDVIRNATKAAVVVAHHTPRDSDRERGSTSLRGAADTMVLLKREDRRLTVTCEKQKEAEHFKPYALELIDVEASCALITAKNSDAVSHLMPGDPRHKALSILHDSSMADGLSTSAWLKATEMKERTFYNARKFLVANGYVDAAPRKGAPNIITPLGIHTVTANCNVTAKGTARQSAAITAAGALSLEEPGAMQYGASA